MIAKSYRIIMYVQEVFTLQKGHNKWHGRGAKEEAHRLPYLILIFN